MSNAAAYMGHVTAVECDSDYGRYWSRFDATGADAREVAAQCAAYIDRLAAADELSDVDCGGNCPCTAPVAGCPDCERWDMACWPHREAYRP
jgi:hypothetical protein